jgi:hypothetical protein
METQIQETYQEREARRAISAKALQIANPHLIPDTGNSLVTAAKNIRIELKRRWPKVQFVVKSRRFSMGDAIDVSWTDGPTSKQVDPIINQYQGGDFDGMTDSFTYRHNDWTRAFGDAKYVHGSRSYSDSMVTKSIAFLQIEYRTDVVPTVEDYRRGNAWNSSPIVNGHHIEDCWQTLIMRDCERTAA